jgi:hypothetical protein
MDERRFLFQCIVSIPWMSIIFQCEYVRLGLTRQSVSDLWWTKWQHWDMFFSEFCCFPVSLSCNLCCIFTHVSSGGWTMGQLAALVSPQCNNKKIMTIRKTGIVSKCDLRSCTRNPNELLPHIFLSSGIVRKFAAVMWFVDSRQCRSDWACLKCILTLFSHVMGYFCSIILRVHYYGASRLINAVLLAFAFNNVWSKIFRFCFLTARCDAITIFFKMAMKEIHNLMTWAIVINLF